MSIRFVALDTELVERLQRGGVDANGHKPERHISSGGMMPCRHCLTDIKAGEPYLILAHRPFPITPTLEGRITSLHFDINDPVKTGDVLALVQTPELIGKPLELKAPIDGIVTERNQAVGELVDKTSAVYAISDPADLWVIAEIKERDLAAVKVGQDASFTVLAYPR